MKSFLRKKESPVVEEEAEKDAEEAPQVVSPTKTAASSNYGFDDDDEEEEVPKEKSSRWGSKKSKKEQPIESQEHEIEEVLDDPKTSESKSNSGRGCCCGVFGCCTCRRLLFSTLCFSVLAAAAIVLWRYGPWAANSSTDVSSLSVADSCDGCCNGLVSNCDLPVNEVLFPMVYRAHSSYDDNFVGAHNNGGFEGALVAGYRALQLSTCMCERFVSKVLLERDEELGLGDSNLGFCHTACGMGVRDPKDVL